MCRSFLYFFREAGAESFSGLRVYGLYSNSICSCGLHVARYERAIIKTFPKWLAVAQECLLELPWSQRSLKDTLSLFQLGLALSGAFTVRACCTRRRRAPIPCYDRDFPFWYSSSPLECKVLKAKDKVLFFPLAQYLLQGLFIDLKQGNQTK